MGCWRESCMLTDLPINYGDRTAVVILAQAGAPKRTSYPHDVWKPILPLVTGDYDDYGGIEYITNEGVIMDILRKADNTGFARLVDSDNQTPIMGAGTELKDIVDAIERGNVSLLFQGTGMAQRLTLAHMKPDYVERCTEFPYSDMIRSRFHKADEEYADRVRSTEYALALMDPIEREKAKLLFDVTLTKRLPDRTAYGLYHPMLEFSYANGGDVVTLFLVDNALNRLRRTWRPTSGCGSQDGIEHAEIVAWYEAVYDDAKTMFIDYASYDREDDKDN